MNPGAKPAMPAFASLEALDEYRALGIAISIIEDFPEAELRKLSLHFLPGDLSSSRAELVKKITSFALESYNGHSKKLTELERFVDDLSRERFSSR